MTEQLCTLCGPGTSTPEAPVSASFMHLLETAIVEYEQNPATTTWGFPVCQRCADFLTRLDSELKAEFPEPPERYIDRARRAIKQRKAEQ